MCGKTRFLVFLLAFAILGNAMGQKRPPNSYSNRQQNSASVLFIRDFFKWYKTKYDYLDHHIFPVATYFKLNRPYRLDFKATERYLSILKSSGYFSDNYIDSRRDYFKKIDLTLQKTKQNDGPVGGLDFDPILTSQEPGSILKNLNDIHLTVLKAKTDTTIVQMVTPFNINTCSFIYLTRYGNKYKIDKIEYIVLNMPL